MLRNYFKIAWRNLLKYKVYSFINIIGLSLGLVCTILIALWVSDERSYDRFHTHAADLYQVMANLHWDEVSTNATVPARLNEALKQAMPEVKYATTLMEDEVLFTVDNKKSKEKGYYVSSDFLQQFTFPVLQGNAATALESADHIVITQQLSEKYNEKMNNKRLRDCNNKLLFKENLILC